MINFSIISIGLVIFSSLCFCQDSLPENENHILNYRPPKWIREAYPYYLSGFSKKGCPVWISQYGQWDVRSTIEAGGQKVLDFDKYMEQGWEITTRPKLFKSPTKKVQNGVVGIIDLNGYSSRQLYHFPTVQKNLFYAQQFVDILEANGSFIERGYLINCNWFFRVMWRMAKPILGDLVKHIELYGYDRDEWGPAIRKYVDSDQLPSWAGGKSNDHEPVATFG